MAHKDFVYTLHPDKEQIAELVMLQQVVALAAGWLLSLAPKDASWQQLADQYFKQIKGTYKLPPVYTAKVIGKVIASQKNNRNISAAHLVLDSSAFEFIEDSKVKIKTMHGFINCSYSVPPGTTPPKGKQANALLHLPVNTPEPIPVLSVRYLV